LQISQGYIIRILQHFATKLWNITNFVMLFQAVMKLLSIRMFTAFQAFLTTVKKSLSNGYG
jgi:valyl-tRNA synthetase